MLNQALYDTALNGQDGDRVDFDGRTFALRTAFSFHPGTNHIYFVDVTSPGLSRPKGDERNYVKMSTDKLFFYLRSTDQPDSMGTTTFSRLKWAELIRTREFIADPVYDPLVGKR